MALKRFNIDLNSLKTNGNSSGGGEGGGGVDPIDSFIYNGDTDFSPPVQDHVQARYIRGFNTMPDPRQWPHARFLKRAERDTGILPLLKVVDTSSSSSTGFTKRGGFNSSKSMDFSNIDMDMDLDLDDSNVFGE